MRVPLATRFSPFNHLQLACFQRITNVFSEVFQSNLGVISEAMLENAGQFAIMHAPFSLTAKKNHSKFAYMQFS